MSTARVNITDRGQRYRANRLIDVKGQRCLFCGSQSFLVPDHWDGIPDNTVPENLEVLCKACNTAKGAAFKRAGRGRLTNQYNPTRGGGAANIGEWMNAVGAITPHVDRGDRGLVTTMAVRDAVDMIRATPQSKRRDFAAQLRRRKNPWFFSRPDARRTTPAHGGVAYHTAKMEAAKRAAPKGKKAAPAVLSIPDEKTLQAGFARGLSLADMLRSNPRLAELRKANPAKFDRCVKAVQRKGGANAYAVCTAKGTRNPQSRYAPWAQSLSDEELKRQVERAEGRSKTETGALQQIAWQQLKALRAEFNKRKGTRGNPSETLNDRDEAYAYAAELKRDGHTGVKVVEHTEKTNGIDYDWFVVSWRSKRNPAGAAAEVFEEFHGFAPSEVVTVTKKIHHHEHLAAAGKLVSLDVWGIDGSGHKISGFGGAFLAFNESKNQLFVEGGDQSVNLDDFGITSAHEFETLGKVTDIGYQTNKTHLGDEGGQAVYVHKFRSTNENGRHVVVRIAREPDLIYDVRNEQLMFSGGSYEILREGIDK